MPCEKERERNDRSAKKHALFASELLANFNPVAGAPDSIPPPVPLIQIGREGGRHEEHRDAPTLSLREKERKRKNLS